MTDLQKAVLLITLLLFGSAFAADLISHLSFIPDSLKVYAQILTIIFLAVTFNYFAEKMGLRF